MSYFRLLSTLMFCIMLTIHSTGILAQEELERARAYPPGLLTKSQLETSEFVIDWKIEQLGALLDSYRKSRKEIDAQVDSALADNEALVKKLPGELRLMDKETRSRLVGKVMESLLDAKLELATRSKEIETLENRLLAKQDDVGMKSELKLSEIAIRAAERKLEVASIEANKTEALFKKAIKSESERRMAQYTMSLAQLELEKALVQHESLKNRSKAEVANLVTDARVSVEPIKARIAAAEKFLIALTEAADVISKIDSINRSIELYQKERQMVATEMSRFSRDLQELHMLRSRIDGHLETIEKSKKDQKPQSGDH